ncbi:unnamed protein product [Clonostachys rosea]|uniref:Protein kinase domain-containing protein n=1 Tax=Bionectria ochroleuca TaxID=29856 RepID=A0ABY6TTJ2_BIOOC|nr:unnamed protein product [Clonostachys rosea]
MLEVEEMGWSQKGKIFALKEFTQYDKFVKEREALDHFSGSNPGHDHLARLLLSFDQAGKWYMIFDWADADLENFWKRFSVDPKSHTHLRWFITQCCGMAQGLSRVHGDWVKPHISTNIPHIPDRGRHGDIKPGNILCFNQDAGRMTDYRLVIADFTLMRFHSPDSLGATSASSVAYSESYRPPEKDIRGTVKIDQLYDVWTIGCVFLEFVTWYLLGYEAVKGKFFRHLGRDVDCFQQVRMRGKIGTSGIAQDDFFEMKKMSFLMFPARVKPSVAKVSYLYNWKIATSTHFLFAFAVVSFFTPK